MSVVRKAAVFIDRDGTINRERGYVTNPDDFEMLPGAAAAIKRLNEAGYLAVVVTNQGAIARGQSTVEILEEIHQKMTALLDEAGAHLDGIYYCPHYPQSTSAKDRVELIGDCDCRKPKTGLLMTAQEELNIDLSKSWMIGDTTSDMRMGADAGVKTILVKTGHAGLDGKCEVEPDFVLDDLGEAVDFIVNKVAKLRVQ